MCCAKTLQLACQCLPQRIKPQTTGRTSLFRFLPSAVLQSRRPICKNCLTYHAVPFFSRAKNQNFLGLLALPFFQFICNTMVEETL